MEMGLGENRWPERSRLLMVTEASNNEKHPWPCLEGSEMSGILRTMVL